MFQDKFPVVNSVAWKNITLCHPLKKRRFLISAAYEDEKIIGKPFLF